MSPLVTSSLLFIFFFRFSLCLDPTLNDDVLGLIVFKADLHDPEGKLSSWNEDDDNPCSWSGVKCDSRTNRVTELKLDGFSLSGKIGRGLLQLHFVKLLSLSGNNITGSIPADIARLGSLQTVDFSRNGLSGVIPDGFFNQCRSVSEVSLANNGQGGRIRESVGSCWTIASLNLSGNRLTGPIPSGLWSLNGLQSLDLSNNELFGEIPGGISKAYNLRNLILRGNRFTGNLPDDIGNCSLLRSIDVSDNSLSGGLSDSLQKLSLCSFLNLRNNSFTGEVPMWIGELNRLETLDFSKNGFTGKIPESIGKLQVLKNLDFSSNRFSGRLPESISGCIALLNVKFRGNELTGNLPKWVFGLGLQILDLSYNKLAGELEIPSSSNLTLKWLLLGGNAFSGKIPALSNLRGLKMLDLSSNSFSGPIPANIGDLRALEDLDLSANHLSGTIPTSIGDLRALEDLDLSANHLSGTIPPEIGGAVSLLELMLGENFLIGSIPPRIEGCSSLRFLVLWRNNLSGSLPPNIANLTNLTTLEISANNFSGTLPKDLSKLSHLDYFNITSNNFSGDLPSGNFFNVIPKSFLADNPGLCGSVVNISCPAVLPKPIVLNPNSSSSAPSDNPASSSSFHQKKIILSISAVIAIAAAALIALGVVAVTVLNFQVRSSAASHSASALVLSDDYYSRSPITDANSGKLVMFSGNVPDFSAGTHAVLNKDCELGRGGFGAVYKTILQDGRPVAIKKLTVSSLVKSQEDFEREVKKLGKLRHQNLVTLEGYYWTPSLQLLIYEFVSRGSLHKHLHDSSGKFLTWQERFDIILGIARSLMHLHQLNIVHYNLKSSNVLIDESGEAKVGDYGLAKLLPMLDHYVLSSKIQSALGYMAPEFACRAVKITEKCDVYAFGVLVLEIVTGRRPVEYMEDDVVVLCDMVRGALEDGRVDECVDGKIGGNFPAEEAVPVMKLGLICTSQVPSNRPDMAEVVNILELIKSPQESLGEESG